MKLTTYYKEKLESTVEWDDSKKIATFTIFDSSGKEQTKKIVEGLASLQEAKKAVI